MLNFANNYSSCISRLHTSVRSLTVGLTYYIRVYDFGAGAPASTTFTICVGGPSTKIVENYNGNYIGFTVSPNPFTNETTIIFTEEQKNTSISITDVLGKVVFKSAVTKGAKNFVLEKGDLKSGIYFLQITDEKKNVSTAKIIITEQ